jgi:hypothetical protein
MHLPYMQLLSKGWPDQKQLQTRRSAAGRRSG